MKEEKKAVLLRQKRRLLTLCRQLPLRTKQAKTEIEKLDPWLSTPLVNENAQFIYHEAIHTNVCVLLQADIGVFKGFKSAGQAAVS